jgi:hypothetical protein
MALHPGHGPRPGRSRPLVSIALAFLALFIPGCEAFEPFLRARTFDGMTAGTVVRCDVAILHLSTHSLRSTRIGAALATHTLGLLPLE